MREEILQPRGVSASLERQRPQGREWGTRWMVLDFRESGADIPNALNSSDEITCYLSQNWVGGGWDGKRFPQKKFQRISLLFSDLFFNLFGLQNLLKFALQGLVQSFLFSKNYSKAISSSDINPIQIYRKVFAVNDVMQCVIPVQISCVDP